MAMNVTSASKPAPDVARSSTAPRPSQAVSTSAGQVGQSSGSPKAPQEIAEVVSELKDYVQSVKRGLEFSVDEGTERTVIKVTDAETGELIRQIPSEELLEIARFIKEQQDASEGIFFKANA